MKKILIILFTISFLISANFEKKYVKIIYSGYTDSIFYVDSDDYHIKIKNIKIKNIVSIYNFMDNKGYIFLSKKKEFYFNSFYDTFIFKKVN